MGGTALSLLKHNAGSKEISKVLPSQPPSGLRMCPLLIIKQSNKEGQNVSINEWHESHYQQVSRSKEDSIVVKRRDLEDITAACNYVTTYMIT